MLNLLTPAAAQQQPDGLVEELQRRADALGLSQSPVWAALLHARDGVAHIRDPDFLLSLPDYSPSREMALTIAALYRDEEAVCRFPARYLWLQRALDAPERDLGRCAELAEFRRRAPAERISIAFAGDNLAQPASMLGHAFLKLEGRLADGREVAHAVSFYTDSNTMNLPKLMYDSIVVGKPGFFSLSPYSEKIERYVEQEQRPVWEYELALDAEQRLMVQSHLIELKQARLIYFFQRYNCATVVSGILAVVVAGFASHGVWNTPRDVLKSATDAGAVSAISTVMPDRWLLKAIAPSLSHADVARLRAAVDTGRLDTLPSTNDDQGFLLIESARLYNGQAFRRGIIDQARWRTNRVKLEAAEAERFGDKRLTVDAGSDPARVPDEAQFGVGYMVDDGQSYASIGLLPLSHRLDDDNRNYLSENELALMHTRLRIRTRDARPELDRFDLYAIRSRIRWDSMTGGISGDFRIAVEPQFDRSLQRHLVSLVDGMMGYTLPLGRDAELYAAAGAGLAWRPAGAFLYPSAEFGLTVREIGNMKTRLAVVERYNAFNDAVALNAFQLNQSIFATRDTTLRLGAQLLTSGSTERWQGTVDLIHLF